MLLFIAHFLDISNEEHLCIASFMVVVVLAVIVIAGTEFVVVREASEHGQRLFMVDALLQAAGHVLGRWLKCFRYGQVALNEAVHSICTLSKGFQTINTVVALEYLWGGQL